MSRVRWRRVNLLLGLAAVVVVTSGRRLGAEPLLVDGVVGPVSLRRGDDSLTVLRSLGLPPFLTPKPYCSPVLNWAPTSNLPGSS
jgi:hypothetical protein